MTSIFFQGDRDLSGPAVEALRTMITWCKDHQVRVVTGAYGAVVKLAHEIGADVTSYGHREQDKGKVPDGAKFVDCSIPGHQYLGWGNRLGQILEASSGAVFFSGREGTLAHLFPFLEFAMKGKKRVALVGWDNIKIEAISVLIDQRPVAVSLFSFDQAEEAISWVNQPLA